MGEEGTTLANDFLASAFCSLGLSLLIHKMEHVASMSSKASRCTRPEHSSLATEASGDGMEPEKRKSCGSKTRRRLVQGRGGAESSEVSAVPSTPAIFTQEHWAARGLAKNISSPSPEHPLPSQRGGVGAGKERGVGTRSLKGIHPLVLKGLGYLKSD